MKAYFDIERLSFHSARREIKKSHRVKRVVALVLIIPITALFIECRSFDRTLLLNKASVDRSVKPMKVIVNYDSIAETLDASPFFLDNEKIKAIATTIKNNMSFEAEGGKYHLSIIIRKAQGFENLAWVFPTSLTLGFIILLGWPALSYTEIIVLSAAIMGPDGRVIKTFDAKGLDTEYAAAYWGYSDIYTTATYKALTLACKDLREQLKQDADNLKRLLK